MRVRSLDMHSAREVSLMAATVPSALVPVCGDPSGGGIIDGASEARISVADQTAEKAPSPSLLSSRQLPDPAEDRTIPSSSCDNGSA
jgi:hypothetical protein